MSDWFPTDDVEIEGQIVLLKSWLCPSRDYAGMLKRVKQFDRESEMVVLAPFIGRGNEYVAHYSKIQKIVSFDDEEVKKLTWEALCQK